MAVELSNGMATTMLPGNETDPFWSRIPFALPYWRQFDMTIVPDYQHYITSVWMTVAGVLGVCGNLLVIYTFFSSVHFLIVAYIYPWAHVSSSHVINIILMGEYS